MSLFIGIDIAIGISSGSSWTAVVALSDKKDCPVYAERFRPQAVNLEKRLRELGQFCYDAISDACIGVWLPVEGVMIAEPKMRGVTNKRKNPKTGRVELITYNTRPMWELAQARGAAVSALETNGIKVYSMVESAIKKAFTDDGRADKEKIHGFAKLQWSNIPDGDYDFADALMVAEILKRRYKLLQREREDIH